MSIRASNRRRLPAEFGYRCGASKLGIDPYEYRAQIEAGQKWCSFHKTWEPRESFGPHPYTRSGLDSQCVEGSRTRSREYRRRKRAELRERREA